jgi:anti-sigma B factor antagonist
LTGEHDLSTLPIIDDAFQRIVEPGTTVIVDLSDATFIDSTIIAAIVMQVRRGETLLLVVPEQGGVRRVLDLVGISAAVQVFENREEALRAVPMEEPRSS